VFDMALGVLTSSAAALANIACLKMNRSA
jgi:hypothetical protein